jgi:uncharacterized membrane protein required for colicin V production
MFNLEKGYGVMLAEMGLTIFDAIAIGFALIFILVGVSRGFARELSAIITWVASLIGAKIFSYPVSDFLYSKMDITVELKRRVITIVENLDFSSLNALRNSISNGLETIPIIGPFLTEFATENWSITEIFQSGSPTIQTELIDTIMKGIEPVAHQVMDIAAFVIVFIGLFIILSIVLRLMVSALTSIKIVGAIDNILGGVLGLVKGALFVIILYSLLFIALSIIGSEHLSVLMESRFFDMVVGIKNFIPA